MKAILTLIFVIVFGVLAVAQEGRENPVQLQRENENIAQINDVETSSGETELPADTIVRLYRFKHSKVRKELTFATRANKPKLA